MERHARNMHLVRLERLEGWASDWIGEGYPARACSGPSRALAYGLSLVLMMEKDGLTANVFPTVCCFDGLSPRHVFTCVLTG